MRKLIENLDGLFYWQETVGKSVDSSAPFEKNSDIYQDKLNKGFELILISQSEKDAHKADLAEEEKKSKLSALDLPLWKIARALDGDEKALADVKESEVKKSLVRDF